MASNSSHKVLIVDDDPSLGTTYKMALELADLEVAVAKSGKEGLEKAKQQMPSVMVVDIMMPNMNGKELLKKLKEDPVTADIPVVICTSLVEELEKKEFMSLGAVDYLVKTDTDPDKLASVIKKILK